MGHASIEETEGTYGHLAPERHEPRVALLDGYLVGEHTQSERVSVAARQLGVGLSG